MACCPSRASLCRLCRVPPLPLLLCGSTLGSRKVSLFDGGVSAWYMQNYTNNTHQTDTHDRDFLLIFSFFFSIILLHLDVVPEFIQTSSRTHVQNMRVSYSGYYGCFPSTKGGFDSRYPLHPPSSLHGRRWNDKELWPMSFMILVREAPI